MRQAVLTVLESVERLRPALLVSIAGVLAVMIALTSYLTSGDIRFSFFYLGPVALAAWFVGRPAGVFFSVLGAGIWLLKSLLEEGFDGRAPQRRIPTPFCFSESFSFSRRFFPRSGRRSGARRPPRE